MKKNITNISFKFLALILFSLLIVNSNNSLASKNCSSKNFLNQVKGEGMGGGEEGSPSKKQLNSVKKNLIKICNFFESGKLKIPKKLNVWVVKKSSKAFFQRSRKYNVIFIPLQLEIKKKGATKHPIYSQPIAAHELGHAYFNSNIPSLTENETYAPRVNRQLAYSSPFSGLSELFADCFSAVYFKNPKIISNSLFFTSVTKTHNLAKKRSFLNRNFQHLVGKKLYQTAPHVQFDKVRHHLWKYYLSNAKYKNKAKLIKNLLQIFGDFLHQKQSKGDFAQTDILTANNLFIEFIDKSFKKFDK